MKSVLTIFLIAGIGFLTKAQEFGPVQDFSEFLKEKREDITNKNLLALSDGSFQLITNENIYKLDNDLKFTGTIEKNSMSPLKFNNSMSLWATFQDQEKNIYVTFNGEDILSFMKLNSTGVNEITNIKVPELIGVKSVGDFTSYEAKMIDDENFIFVYGAPTTTENTHGKSKPAKDKLSGFVRVLKVNIKTQKVVDKFMFIDKVDGNPKEIRNIKYNVFNLDENKVQIGVMKGLMQGAQYEPYTKVDATYEIWELNFTEDTEEKLTETKVKTLDNIRFCDINCDQSVSLTYTIEIGSSNTFALYEEIQTFADGEWKTSTTAWPKDQVQISFPGAPIQPVVFADENGNEIHAIQGNVAKSRNNKEGISHLIFFDHNGQIIIKEVPEDLVHFYFIYTDKNQKARHFLYETDLPEDVLKKMVNPLLKNNKMVNYLIKSNSLESFPSSNELILIHSDWRVTSGIPDYMVQRITITK